MDLRQLRGAVALADAGHFTRAAEGLGIAQPALSLQVSSLERELGVRLFERSSRRVRLTDAGRVLVEEARRIVHDVDGLAAAMQEYAGALRGRVVLGTLQLFSELTLPGLLGRFHRAYPGVEIALREDVTESMLAGLRAGTLDAAIVNVNDPSEQPDIVFRFLFADEVSAAVSRGHALADRRSIGVGDLRDEQFVAFKAGSGLYAAMMNATRSHGFEPRVMFESGDPATLRALASEGLGVALLPRPYLEAPGPPISVLTLRPRIERRVSIAYREGVLSPAARRLVDFLCRAVARA